MAESSRPVVLPLLYALAAAAALSMAVLPLLGLPCERCTGGAVSLVLPWVGGAFYAGLTLLARRRPASAALAQAASLSVFVHADLLIESARMGRLCWGCLAVAALAFAAAGARAVAARPERLPLAASLLLGGAAGVFAPYERVDGLATRMLWPARLLADLPAVVDRDRVFACEHAAPVRLLVYEKDCKVCGSVSRRLLPELRAQLGDRLCVHLQEVPAPPPGTRLPLFVAAARDRSLLVLEGHATLEEVREAVLSLLERRAPRLVAGP